MNTQATANQVSIFVITLFMCWMAVACMCSCGDSDDLVIQTEQSYCEAQCMVTSRWTDFSDWNDESIATFEAIYGVDIIESESEARRFFYPEESSMFCDLSTVDGTIMGDEVANTCGDLYRWVCMDSCEAYVRSLSIGPTEL